MFFCYRLGRVDGDGEIFYIKHPSIALLLSALNFVVLLF